MYNQTTETVKMHHSATQTIQATLKGRVLAPEHPGFDEARTAWNLSVQQYPALIVKARTASDIVEAVRFASREGLNIAVQATGHGVIRPADGCLLILTAEMKDVTINPEERTARVAAGAQWGAVLEAAHPHGLAPLLGSSPGVGAVGYTLGGGLGWLARKYGLSTDSVLGFELVSADGRLLRASRDENRELFWGLRGGGKGLGVITSMEIQLYPISHVFGGSLIYPVDVAAEVFRRYRDWIADMPEEMTTSVKIANFPPVEMVPEFFRGKSFVLVNGCYCGPLEHGQDFIQGWLDWQEPLVNGFRVMPFSEVAVISSDPEGPVPGYSSGAWLKHLSDATIETILRFAVPQGKPSPYTIAEVRHVGGAMGRVERSSNAFAQREASLLMNVIAFTPTPELGARVREVNVQFLKALAPNLAEGVYMNFLDGEEAHQATRVAYSAEDYRRLAMLKSQYDPQNLFRFGYDIQPES